MQGAIHDVQRNFDEPERALSDRIIRREGKAITIAETDLFSEAQARVKLDTGRVELLPGSGQVKTQKVESVQHGGKGQQTELRADGKIRAAFVQAVRNQRADMLLQTVHVVVSVPQPVLSTLTSGQPEERADQVVLIMQPLYPIEIPPVRTTDQFIEHQPGQDIDPATL